MTIPVATVIGGRPWEAELVATARNTGLARIVARCVDPADVTRASPPARVVVVGSETPWLTPAVVRTWRHRGLAVVGVHPPSDRPGRRLLAEGGCDLIVGDDRPALEILGELAAVAPPPPRPTVDIVAVTGPRGAPGRTEVALALAWVLGGRAPTVLAECDFEGRALGLRLALAPATAGMRLDRVGPIDVLHLAPGAGPLSESLLARTLATAGERFEHVVTDVGPRIPTGSGPTILVTTPAPVLLVRTAAMLHRWEGPPPLLVANRVGGTSDLRAVRRATGLEPAAAAPVVAPPRPGSAPPRPLLRALEELAGTLAGNRVSGPPGSSRGNGGRSASPGAARRPMRRPRARADG